MPRTPAETFAVSVEHHYMRCGFRPGHAASANTFTLTRWLNRGPREDWTLLAVAEGVAHVRQHGLTVTLHPNAMCIVRPGSRWSLRTGEDRPVRTVEFLFGLIRETPLHANPLGLFEPLLPVDHPAPGGVAAAYARVLPHVHANGVSRSPTDQIAVGGILNAILADFLVARCRSARSATPPAPELPPWVMELRAYLEANLNRPDLSLRELASFTGYSAGHIVWAFRRHMGVSPFQYLQRVRIERACRLLRAGPAVAKIPVIARRCGYRNVSLFHRHFKRHMRVTPLQYERQTEPPPD